MCKIKTETVSILSLSLELHGEFTFVYNIEVIYFLYM
jgi:hypothetical protein